MNRFPIPGQCHACCSHLYELHRGPSTLGRPSDWQCPCINSPFIFMSATRQRGVTSLPIVRVIHDETFAGHHVHVRPCTGAQQAKTTRPHPCSTGRDRYTDGKGQNHSHVPDTRSTWSPC